MRAAFVVGDEVVLPSGRRVEIVAQASRSRPWAAVQTGFVWHVCRPRKAGPQAPASYYFDPARPTALQLDEADALALAEALNCVPRSGRKRKSS